MSVESAKDFIRKVRVDATLRKKSRERFGEIEKVGREHGHDFTREEFDSLMRERRAQGKGKGKGQHGPNDDPPDDCLCFDDQTND